MSDNLSDNIKEYSFVGIIGSGSFSTCYKVSHRTSGCIYVWKAIDYGWMSEDDKQIFISEVEQLSSLRHSNIIQFFPPINHKVTFNCYIRMQYYDRGNLLSLIKRHKELNNYIDETFIWGVLYQISRALHAFHSKLTKVTILYCDIRPAHIFLDNFSNLRLGGFSLNKKFMKNYSIEPEVSYETLTYLSPEVISNGQSSKKSEIWSLGCLIHELASLSPPFIGSNTNNLAENIKIGKRSKLPIHYSDDLQKIIDLMLVFDLESRPSAEAILYHPQVVSRVALNTLQQLSLKAFTKPDLPQTCAKCKDMENKFEFFQQKEVFLKAKEKRLKEKEFYLVRREKQVMLLEQMHKEKLKKTETHPKSRLQNNEPVEDLNDSSYSADPGDTSILPTASKLDLKDIAKPSFVRKNTKRTVHFGTGSSYDFGEIERTGTINCLYNKKEKCNTKVLGKVLKNQNRENHNKENKIPSGFQRASVLPLNADTLETSKGILETHFI